MLKIKDLKHSESPRLNHRTFEHIVPDSMTVTLKGRLSTEMTSQNCPLCYEMDEGSGLEYQWSCCHEDSDKGQ